MKVKLASILIHLDFLSIYLYSNTTMRHVRGFNPYSPGFSIYLRKITTHSQRGNCFNPYSPGFSIYLQIGRWELATLTKLQSLFTWIFYLFEN